MKKEFFVNLIPGALVKHRIHEKECPFNYNSENRIPLGSFLSDSEALSEAEKLFHGTLPCPFCLKELIVTTKQESSARNSINEVPVSFSSIMPTWDSVFVSALS